MSALGRPSTISSAAQQTTYFDTTTLSLGLTNPIAEYA
jgi:hypothetical protein